MIDVDSALARSATVADPDTTVILIRPSQNWQLINLRELWQFHELIFFLIWRDVKVRYKQTALGAAWAVLQPIMMMVVFTIFFGRMAGVSSSGLPYPLFVYAGLLPWTFFSAAITGAGNSVVGSERLITKIYFPRLAVPFAAVGAAIIDFLIALGLLIPMAVYYKVAPSPDDSALAPFVFVLILLAGLGSWHVALSAQCCLPRFSLRDSVYGPGLDVCNSDDLHAAT